VIEARVRPVPVQRGQRRGAHFFHQRVVPVHFVEGLPRRRIARERTAHGLAERDPLDRRLVADERGLGGRPRRVWNRGGRRGSGHGHGHGRRRGGLRPGGREERGFPEKGGARDEREENEAKAESRAESVGVGHEGRL
jgi:hypothetical protein